MSPPISRDVGTGLLALLTSAGAIDGALAQTRGSVAAVNPSASGTPPGGASRTLVIGNSVVLGERVRTTVEGTVQLLFPDKSTVNVGRNSTLVIDEFVYDPNARTGSMALSLAQGALRFVGGQVSHTKGAVVNTPVSTIGIRGGVASIVYPITALGGGGGGLPAAAAGCKGALVVGSFGATTVQNNVSSVTIQRPGYAVCVPSANEPISEPFPVPDALMARIIAMLTNPGGRGGSTQSPTDAQAAQAGIGSTRLNDPSPPPGVTVLDATSIFSAGDSVVRNNNQTRQPGQVVRPTVTTVPTVHAAATSPSAATSAHVQLRTGRRASTLMGAA